MVQQQPRTQIAGELRWGRPWGMTLTLALGVSTAGGRGMKGGGEGGDGGCDQDLPGSNLEHLCFQAKFACLFSLKQNFRSGPLKVTTLGAGAGGGGPF